MMAASQGISEELVCSICLDTYKSPVILPCAHSFCKQCLMNMQERSQIRRQLRAGQNSATSNQPSSSSQNVLACPHCRAETSLGTGGIENLPRNTTLANIILSLEEEKKAKNILCEVCDYDPPRRAAKVCSDCAVTYCQPCFSQLHPLRGAFKYHIIKEAIQSFPVMRCTSPVFDQRLPSTSGRFTPCREMTDGAESGDEGGTFANQDQLEKIRRQIKSKRKELNGVMKNVQTLLKLTEEETEERMREVRSICTQINESVGEKEASMLTKISQQRHDTVKECLSLSTDVKSQTGTLDLLEDQVNDVISITAVYAGTDVSNDITSLQEKLSEIQSKSLISRSKRIPRQPKIAEVNIVQHISSIDFAKENVLPSPVLTEIVHKPVAKGPALVEIKWRPVENATKYRLSVSCQDGHGIEVMIKVDLAAITTSYTFALPYVDTEYFVCLTMSSEEGKHPQVGRSLRTLPYVHCVKVLFNPITCHKKVAVALTKDEIVHRKCKLASLNNACPSTTSHQRLETLEGACAEECLPILPFIYWESIIHFNVFGRLANSRLLCDVGVSKQGCEDECSPLCDNFKSYCAYLVRRNNKICLEFWNGANRENLSRSIPVVDLDQDTEKSIRLGFYYDAIQRVFIIISPGNNSILSRFQVKFASVLPVCGLYSCDQVFVMIRFTEPQKLPNILCRLMRGN